MQKLNLNDRVLIRITAKGEQYWQEHYKRLCLDVPPIERDGEGYTEMHLWEVMQYFGEGLYDGCEPPIETDFYLKTQAA